MSATLAEELVWLRPKHVALLSALVAHRQLTNPSAAALLGLSPSSISRLARPLIEHGYITRDTDPTDYRVVTLAPTASGRRLSKACHSQKDTTP